MGQEICPLSKLRCSLNKWKDIRYQPVNLKLSQIRMYHSRLKHVHERSLIKGIEFNSIDVGVLLYDSKTDLTMNNSDIRNQTKS